MTSNKNIAINNMDEEREPLLDKSELEQVTHSRIIKPKRHIVIEPVLIAYVLFGMPLYSLSSQYIFYRFYQQLQGGNTTLLPSQQNASECYVDKNTSEYKLHSEAQQLAANFGSYITLMEMGPAIFVTQFLGSYSDKMGRKWSILPPLIGDTLQVVVYGMVVWFNLPIYALLFAPFIQSFGGRAYTLFLGTFSYIADTVEPEKRAFRITVIEMTSFGSSVLSNIGLGYLIEYMGFFWPLVISASGYILIILYVIFLVPETVIKVPGTRFCNLKHFKGAFNVYWSQKEDNRRWRLLYLLSLLLVYVFAAFSTSIDSLFMLNTPFCWSPLKIGYYGALTMAVYAVSTILGVGLLKRCIDEQWIVMVGLATGTISYAYHAFCVTDVMMYILPFIGVVGGAFVPVLRAIMSQIVEPEEQGAMFAGISVVEAVSSSLGTIATNSLYAATVSWFRGFTYLFKAGLKFFVILLFGIYMCKFGTLKKKVKDVDEKSKE